MKQYKRSARVGEQMLRELSLIFQQELKEMAPAMVTFTHVKLTDDLRSAVIYFSSLGTAEQHSAVALFLEKEKKKIRQLIAANLRIRFAPEISFKFDRSIEEGLRIEQLLNEIKADHHE